MRFRPEHDPRPGGPVEWEDNFVSNLLAHLSFKVTPSWCQTPEHWSSRIVQYLFTDCPCCLFFRGALVGALFTLILAAPALIVLALL